MFNKLNKCPSQFPSVQSTQGKKIWSTKIIQIFGASDYKSESSNMVFSAAKTSSKDFCNTTSKLKYKKEDNFVPKYQEESAFTRKAKELQTFQENLLSPFSIKKYDHNCHGLIQKEFLTDNKRKNEQYADPKQ